MLVTSLVEQEKIIKKGLDTFYTVGQALLVIRDEKLYRETHETFETYCLERWGISRSQGYNLIDAGIVAGSVQGELPDRITHVAPLKKIKNPELREKALTEINSSRDATGQTVHEIVQKYVLIESGSPLGEKLLNQTITPSKAVRLEKRLTELPDYYREAVWIFGLSNEAVSPMTLTAIRALEYEFKDEAIDLLRSGYLNETPLYELHESQVRSHLGRLRFEASQMQAIDVALDQKNQSKFKILHGAEVYDADLTKLSVVFPKGVPMKDLPEGYCVIYLGQKVNFDGVPVQTKNLTDVVPQSLLNFMEALCV